MIPEQLYSKIFNNRDKDLVLTPVETTTLLCTLYFYERLFKKLNLTTTLDQEEHHERKSIRSDSGPIGV